MMVITSPSVSSNGNPPTKTYAESTSRLDQRCGEDREGMTRTFIVIVPTCRCSVPAECELTFIDAVDLADDAAKDECGYEVSWEKGRTSSWSLGVVAGVVGR